MKDPAELTLTEIAGALRRRTFSSCELTRWMLARIARWQPIINAFVRIEEDEALAAAKKADRALARGNAKGALHGVPLAHKDMYYVKGKVSECGSKLRKGWIAPATATVLTRLAAAGSFRIGALHMSEFAYSPTGHNSYLGPACNAWDPKCITGGSSSGSATAVAARLIPAALGSDTGGSIRLPAHFCGVTGFKPTYGRVSRANALPLSFTLDTVGPLALSAEDAVQADLWTRQPRQRAAAIVHPRYRRPAGAERGRRRGDHGHHCRARSARSNDARRACLERQRHARVAERIEDRGAGALLRRRSGAGDCERARCDDG